MKNLSKYVVVVVTLCAILLLNFTAELNAAPSNGTNFPKRNNIESGYEFNAMFERPLRASFGNIKNYDNFYTLTWGVYDWLAVDGKVGFGDAANYGGKLPRLEYNTGFAGGYGFRIRAYKNEKWGVRAIIGAQHISVHPQSRNIDNDKYDAILDDWQVSGIIAKDFKPLTLYAGMKGSDCALIYKLNGHDRKRVSSKYHIGLIVGTDLYFFDKKARVNVEGRFFDETALSTSVAWSF